MSSPRSVLHSVSGSSPPRPPRPTRPDSRPDRPPPPKKPLRVPKRNPPPTRPPLPSKNKCPGVCIPDVMLSLCAPPSIVSPKGGCPKGTFCCDHKGQNPLTRVDPGPRPTPPPRPPRPAPPPPQQSSGPDFSKLFLQMAPTLIGAATGSQSTAQTMTSLLPLLGMLGPMLSSNRISEHGTDNALSAASAWNAGTDAEQQQANASPTAASLPTAGNATAPGHESSSDNHDNNHNHREGRSPS